MNTEFFIAKRLSQSQSGDSRISKLMARIASLSIMLSLAVMIISVAILSGFKQQIKSKLTGFVSDIRITNYDSNRSIETTTSIADYYDFIPQIKAIKGVKNIQKYATKGGIIKTEDEIQGIVLNGIASDFDWTFFQSYLVDGKTFTVNDSTSSNKVLISQTLANLLNLKAGDAFEVYFVQEPVRVRKFTISGIYNTFFEEQDRNFVLCDMKHIQRLNGWEKNQISGFQILLNDIDDLQRVYNEVDDIVSYIDFDDGSRLSVTTVADANPQMFNWLGMLDMNVLIILVLMLVVSGFNMISGLLIMLLEKASMIGVLKALGMRNAGVRKIFLYRTAIIVLRGMLWGNIIGIGCCLLQQHFGIFKLNPADYYFSVVPIQINALHILLLNVCSFALIIVIQLLPSMFIAKISPAKTIRFD